MRINKQGVGIIFVAGIIALTVFWAGAQALSSGQSDFGKLKPVPIGQIPRTGTFYSLQHSNQPPLPFLPFPELPVYALGKNEWFFDDRTVDYAALEQERFAMKLLEATALGLTLEEMELGARNSMMSQNLAYSSDWGTRPYLTNLVVTTGSGPTASFDIAGGTNNVPYDILQTTNVADAVSSWTWLGIGYTSNRYSFTNQPGDMAFYALAKPSKTTVIGWGDDSVGQCAVPSGLSNAVMVAGGQGHSLALRSDGTVAAWGNNANGQASVPGNLAGVAMIAAGWNHNVVLFTNGLVTNWGGGNVFGELNLPADLTNALVISAFGLHTLALRSNGTVVAWGNNTSSGETNVPAGLADVVAIAAGWQHNLAVKSDGTVVAWGNNASGQTNVPSGLNNVWDVAAGLAHCLALRRDGTVIAWGGNAHGETSVPTNLTNVVAIAAGGDPFVNTAYSLALKRDGTVVAWGSGQVLTALAGLSNVFGIAGGTSHALAVRSGPPTPVLTLLPANQYQLAGGSVTFTARAEPRATVHYQWRFYGTNLVSATNATLTLSNLQTSNEGAYSVTVTNLAGTITSPDASFQLVAAPIIISQSQPTNRVCIYGNYLSFTVTASAPGQFNGFPLSYQWQLNGTNISDATNTFYETTAGDTSGTYSVLVTNAVGSVSANWQLTVTNVIDVTKDLLLIYNTNSADSIAVKDYYLAHRPMVSGANVLGVGYSNSAAPGYFETITPADLTNKIFAPVQSWLSANPTKRPQYVILFLDLPSRVNDTATFPTNGSYLTSGVHPSVGVQFRSIDASWRPYVTHINMDGTNDCLAYINKLAAFGTNLMISASAGGYGNTNYVIDDVRYPGNENQYLNRTEVAVATNGLQSAGVPSSAIQYLAGIESPSSLPHLTNFANVAGYISWGFHSSLGSFYAVSGGVRVNWSGNSGWWIIETIESSNGMRYGDSGTFIQWFSPNAFGGSNYSNTPVGAVSHVDEPGLPGVNDAAKYFGLWTQGKNFGTSAWVSRMTVYFQAVGDPFVAK